ncbi:hypothetical protein AVEN_12691-1 [Araneus ventricosus]|uniref:Uncharacterized protein n=1 Tax=Araneus ventricosus TaxID=182803 RepID=A0A4Y2ABG1_ARAVE|nr:hypothetical protein AVEN_12691-1 [Araneus ventricosus]
MTHSFCHRESNVVTLVWCRNLEDTSDGDLDGAHGLSGHNLQSITSTVLSPGEKPWTGLPQVDESKKGGDQVSNLEPFVSEAYTLPLGHRRYWKEQVCTELMKCSTVQQRIPRLPLLDDFTPERGVRQ